MWYWQQGLGASVKQWTINPFRFGCYIPFLVVLQMSFSTARDKENAAKRSTGDCTIPALNILRPIAFGREGHRRLHPSNQPLSIEHFCRPDEVSNGNGLVCSSHRQEGKCDVLSRTERFSLPDSVHLGLIPFFCFSLQAAAHHFRALCFGLKIAPFVFTRVLCGSAEKWVSS